MPGSLPVLFSVCVFLVLFYAAADQDNASFRLAGKKVKIRA